MHSTFTTRPEDATPDWSWVDLEIVVVAGPDLDLVAQYRVTCSDRETGRLVGSTVVAAGPGGRPPAVTVAHVVELIGGYRFASVYVEIEAERLARVNRRVADSRRSRARAWLRNVPCSVLAEHGIAPVPVRGGRP